MYAEAVSIAAPFVLPAGWWLVALDTTLTAHDAYEAVRAAQSGDLAPAGEWLVVTALDELVDAAVFPGPG